MRSNIRPEVQTVIDRVKENKPDFTETGFGYGMGMLRSVDEDESKLTDEEKAYRMQLNSEEVTALLEAVETNAHIEKLYLGTTELNSQQAEVLANILEKNTKISALGLRMERPAKDVVEILVAALNNNKSISYMEVRFFNNPILELEAIAEVLKENKTIVTWTNMVFGDVYITHCREFFAGLTNNWAVISGPFVRCNDDIPYFDRFKMYEFAERNKEFAQKMAQICVDLLEGQKKAELDDPDSRATIFSRKNLSALSVEMHSLAYELPLTFWDFQKLNQGGYAALKYTVESEYKLERKDIDFIIVRLKELEPHIYVRDVVLAGRSKELKQNMIEQIFAHHSSLDARIDALASGTPDSGFRVITDEALRDLGLEEKISKGVQFFQVLMKDGIRAVLAGKVGEALDLETKMKLLGSQRALNIFLKALKTEQALPHDYSSLANTALQTIEGRKKRTVDTAVAEQSTKRMDTRASRSSASRS
jgi:antitoxin component of RelBE/YafQ-DinJ toxin-antitoxin module